VQVEGEDEAAEMEKARRRVRKAAKREKRRKKWKRKQSNMKTQVMQHQQQQQQQQQQFNMQEPLTIGSLVSHSDPFLSLTPPTALYLRRYIFTDC
jgi:hypothetical protein